MNEDMIKIFRDLTIFNKYRFYEGPHIYTCNGVKVGLSVTKLIEEYSDEFDKDKWADICAKREKISKQEIIERWDRDNAISKCKGTHIHAYVENILSNKVYSYPQREVESQFGEDVLKDMWPKLTAMADEFTKDISNRLIPIKEELLIGDEDFDICGTVDNLFWNNKTKKIEIFDTKSNKEIKFKSFGDKGMKPPLEHILDCNFYHYSLQLNIYKYILQKNTSLEIGDCRIVWYNINSDKYEIITCKDLYEEAKQMLELRKVNA